MADPDDDGIDKQIFGSLTNSSPGCMYLFINCFIKSEESINFKLEFRQ